MKKECRYWLREYHAKDSRQQLNTEEACEWPQGCKMYETGTCPFHTDNFKLVNLTPHSITFFTEDGEVILELPACPNPPRVSTVRETCGQVKGIPVNRVTLGQIQGLPDPQPGVGYIVSRVIAETVLRPDLYIPDMTVRDDQGRIIGCQALAQIY